MTPKPAPTPAVEKRVVPKRVWKNDELRQHLMPTLQNMWQLDESIPFRQPVDPVALNIPVCALPTLIDDLLGGKQCQISRGDNVHVLNLLTSIDIVYQRLSHMGFGLGFD